MDFTAASPFALDMPYIYNNRLTADTIYTSFNKKYMPG